MPKKKGRPALGKKPSKDTLISLYETEERSIREIAGILNCSKDMIFRCLREYEISLRVNARRSRLNRYDLSFLEEGVRAKGLRGFARELKVDGSTLLHHIKTRK